MARKEIALSFPLVHADYRDTHHADNGYRMGQKKGFRTYQGEDRITCLVF